MENIETNEIEQGFDWDGAGQVIIALSLVALFLIAGIKAYLM